MIRVTRSAVIDAPIERVWAVLRDFNSHDQWHDVVAQTSVARAGHVHPLREETVVSNR